MLLIRDAVVASTRCTVTTLLPILHPVYACGQTVALVQCTSTILLQCQNGQRQHLCGCTCPVHSNCAATQALDTRRIEHQLHLFNALQLPCTGAAVMRRACIQPLHLSSALQLRCYRRSNANASSSPCCICSMHCDYLATPTPDATTVLQRLHLCDALIRIRFRDSYCV